MRRRTRLCAVVLFLLISHSAIALDTIKFGIFTSGSPETIVDIWTPLIDYLSREIGIPCEMVLREDYRSMLEALERREVDIAEGGPRTSTAAIDRGIGSSLMRIVRFDQDIFRIMILAAAKSDIWQLRDLQAKRFALVDELSTFGYLFPRITLHKAGIENPETFFHQIFLMGSHEHSIEAVIDGAVDGAAVLNFFYNRIDPKQQAQIRVVYQSDPIPSDADDLVIRSGLDGALQEKLRTALLKYHEQVPLAARRVVTIDRFAPTHVGEAAYQQIRADLALGSSLPKLTYLIPYQQTPMVIARRIESGKQSAFLYIFGIFGVGLCAMLLCAVVLRPRLSAVIVGSFTGIVGVLMAAFSAIQLIALCSAIDTFAYRTIAKIENLNLRLSAASAQSSDILDHLLQVATHDSPIRYANLLRNGVIMAASGPQERGASIIDRVRANTFRRTDAQSVQIIDPIIIERQRFASLQLGISMAPIAQMVRRAVTINAIAMFAAIGLGAGAIVVIRRKYAERFTAIASAVNQLREGGVARIDASTAELRPLAQSLNRLSREFSEKEELLALVRHDADPQITKALIERFERMENDHPHFRTLRQTEALGQAPAWMRCLRDAAIRSKDKEPVVILGPSGAGKTSVARVIHALSPRQSQPMGEVNCAELAAADPLVVLGKLFGYGVGSGIAGIDKGGQKGMLEEYDGGTLFLDEVGILPMQAQQLLLLPLEGRPFNPAAGKGPPQQVNVRWIFATNEPLEELVRKGLMRHDLLRRIQGRGVIYVPALAQRTEDIDLLAQHFLGQLNRKQATMCRFHPDTVTVLTLQPYAEYNISELRGVVHQAYDNALFDNAQQITPAHLPAGLKRPVHISSPTNAAPALYDEEEQHTLQALRDNEFNITRAEAHIGYASGAKTLTNRFRGLIYKTLAITRGDVEGTIRALVGNRNDCREKVKAKVVHYMDMLRRHSANGDTAKLVNNLPQKYHTHLATAAQVIQST